MILELRRVALHPWHAIHVLRPAIDRNVDGVNEERRRLVRDIHRKLDAVQPEDETKVLAPHVRLPKPEILRRQRVNEALRKADPDGWKSSPVYEPMPTPDACDLIDLTDGEFRFARACVVLLLSDRSFDNTYADGLIATLEALDAASSVRIDTDKIAAAAAKE